MIRIFGSGHHPAHGSKLTVLDVEQDVGFRNHHVIHEVLSGAHQFAVHRLGDADVADGCGSSEERSRCWSVVFPTHLRVVQHIE